ncbi:YafY family protein [Paucibacter sp. APW11]|uniref:YafY family protein n=1 Tax=Roseateles aquae TaxID=3077235 RepID=A0ABU3PB30_9BURK|nr:YafY family protein [Paucibacter sp. APW11]MDT8999784.1 YafY family protein [Paucibacter sp. APW11]
MRKAERLFQLVNLIRVHQPVTAATLAERLGVSVRSIYRYIDDLSLSGIPLYGEAGVGYALHEHFELPPLSLSAAELQALQFAVALARQSAGRQLGEAAASLQAKLEAALSPGALAHEPARLRAMAAPLSCAQQQRWDQLMQAIEAGLWLRLSYRREDGRRSFRRVLPLGLFYWRPQWTVGAWCGLRQQFRDFRLDRIETLEPCEAIPGATAPGLEQYLAQRQAEANAWAQSQAESAKVRAPH